MPISSFELSILIPTLGHKLGSLSRLLQQLSRQTLAKEQFEVLVVLNGAEQHPELDALMVQWSFVSWRLLKTSEKGVNVARTLGMRAAQGEILLMLDDDVELSDQNYLNKILQAHQDFPEVCALGGVYLNKKNYSLLDRIYNLDARLSLRASRRGNYSTDLLGGCVSYKRKKMLSYQVWPTADLAYGAAESEFHHRLFHEGALLKFHSGLAVYHQPQMTLRQYAIKAFRQGRGFQNHCRFNNGAKKKLALPFALRWLLALRELFYSWGRGDFFLKKMFSPFQRVYLKAEGWMIERASRLKWAVLRWYGEHVNSRTALRMNHYDSAGTVLLNPGSVLANAWPTAEKAFLAEGLSLLSVSGNRYLCADIAQFRRTSALSPWLQQHSDARLALCCSDQKLTPYEVKRNLEAFCRVLRTAKYKGRVQTIALIDGEELGRWPEPQILHESKVSTSGIKFSVVIPSYNNSLFLKKVVQCLLVQNYQKEKYEVILVSDGSAAEEVAEMRLFLSGYPEFNISYIQWEKAKGWEKEFRAGMARQIGALHAQGEYLSFLDSDILTQPDYLRELEKSLDIYDVVQAKRRMLDEKTTSGLVEHCSEINAGNLAEGTYQEESYWENFKSAMEWEALWAYWKYTCTYSLTLKKQNFFNLGGFRSHYNRYGFEDVDLGYRCYMARLRFGFLKSDVFHLYPQGAGTLHHFNMQQREKMLVQSCETFYRLNLSLALFEEFKFFLQGRNFNYQSLHVRDLTRLLWWKAYFLSFQHSMRLKSSECFWAGNDLAQRSYGITKKSSIALVWKVHQGYYNHVHPLVIKPYHFTKYQVNKRILFRSMDEREVQNG